MYKCIILDSAREYLGTVPCPVPKQNNVGGDIHQSKFSEDNKKNSHVGVPCFKLYILGYHPLGGMVCLFPVGMRIHIYRFGNAPRSCGLITAFACNEKCCPYTCTILTEFSSSWSWNCFGLRCVLVCNTIGSRKTCGVDVVAVTAARLRALQSVTLQKKSPSPAY